MAMAVGGKKGVLAEVNITPLIDVLLVLIIIFMVITPLAPKGLDALVPQPSVRPPLVSGLPDPTIVVSIDAERNIRINRDVIDKQRLGSRLEEIYKTRNERVMFVKGDSGLRFDEVAEVIDIARGSGVDKIGLITKELQ